jgi:phosphatidylinositol-3-phosphatase
MSRVRLPARPPFVRFQVRPAVEELEARLVLSTIPTPDHVVIVMEENHAISQVIGNHGDPYINSLAQQGALFTKSFGVTHPSQPNYLDLFSGSSHLVFSDNCPVGPFNSRNLGGELISAGDTFGSFAEDMPDPGFTGCSYQSYVRKHNPSTDFSSVPAEDNMPFFDYFPTSDFSTLPTVSFVIPNEQNDMHSGTIPQADAWLQTNIDPYLQWAYQNNSLLIVTWDEDDGLHNNHIATIFDGPMVQAGQYSERINHYNVLRTVEDMYGLPYAGASATANPITDVWITPAALVTASVSPTTVGEEVGPSMAVTTPVTGNGLNEVSPVMNDSPGQAMGQTPAAVPSAVSAGTNGPDTLALNAGLGDPLQGSSLRS